MECPECKADTTVVDTRELAGKELMRRRRKCTACDHKFTTVEMHYPVFQDLIKRPVALVKDKTVRKPKSTVKQETTQEVRRRIEARRRLEDRHHTPQSDSLDALDELWGIGNKRRET